MKNSFPDNSMNDDPWYDKFNPRKSWHSQRKKWIAIGVASLAFAIAVPMVTYFSISLVTAREKDKKNDPDSNNYSLTWKGPSNNDKKRTATDSAFSSSYIINNWIGVDSRYIDKYGNPKIDNVGSIKTGRLTTTITFNKDAHVWYDNSQIYDHQIVFQTSGFYIGEDLNINIVNTSIAATQADFATSITTGWGTAITIEMSLDVLTHNNIIIRDYNNIIIDSKNDNTIVSITGQQEGSATTGDVSISIKYKINPITGQEAIKKFIIPENKFIK